MRAQHRADTGRAALMPMTHLAAAGLSGMRVAAGLSGMRARGRWYPHERGRKVAVRVVAPYPSMPLHSADPVRATGEQEHAWA